MIHNQSIEKDNGGVICHMGKIIMMRVENVTSVMVYPWFHHVIVVIESILQRLELHNMDRNELIRGKFVSLRK